MVSEALLEQCRRGNPEAFEELVRRTHRQVYTMARRLVGDSQEAEDVAQEAYLRVYRSLGGFRGEASFETWLYRIVTNAAMSHLRRRGRFGEVLADPETTHRQLAAPVHDEEPDRDRVRAALEGLPLGMRMPIWLKDVYGMSVKEIAREMGLSEGAVKVRLHRGRKRLAEVLHGRDRTD